MLYLLHFQSKCQWNIRGDRDQDFIWLPHPMCKAHPVSINLSTTSSNLSVIQGNKDMELILKYRLKNCLLY